MAFFLEIIKITLPALIVFLTAYYLLKNYLDNQYQMKHLELRQQANGTTIPLRLQAYERLSLFCERISLPTVLLRVREEDMSASQLRLAMLLAVQAEYEHNITQQVYVSDQLWQIVRIARDDAAAFINLVADEVPAGATGREFGQTLLRYLSQQPVMSTERALVAIKKEAALLLG